MRPLVLVTLALFFLGALALAQGEGTAPAGDPPAEHAGAEDVVDEDVADEDADLPGEDAAGEDALDEDVLDEDAGAEDSPAEDSPAAVAPAPANQQVVSSLSIRRGERTILVNQYAPGEAGGRFILRNPACEEEERVSTVYAPEPYLVETVVGEMRILSRIVLERQPEEGQERTRLEMIDAELEIDEQRCPQNITPTGEGGVTLVEGRSTVRGSHLLYDNATGLGTLAGTPEVPVTLEREAEGEGERLSARADGMAFNVDDDSTLLRGNVTVESGARVSEASEFEYDEATNIAFLRGTPERLATSREGADVVSGELIEYDLSTNDVVVTGSVSGTIQID